jgi:hypothetical protein
MQFPCAVLYCRRCTIWLYRMFPHYLIKGTIFGKKVIEQKCMFWFSLHILFETLLIIRRLQRDIINVHSSSCKVTVILVRDEWKLNFLNRFSKYAPISNFMKIYLVGAELFHAERKTDMTKLIVAFRKFSKAPNKYEPPWGKNNSAGYTEELG